MRIAGWCEIQKSHEVQLSWGIAQKVGPANDSGDFGLPIVVGCGELVGNDSVAAFDNEISCRQIDARALFTYHHVFKTVNVIVGQHANRSVDDGVSLVAAGTGVARQRLQLASRARAEVEELSGVESRQRPLIVCHVLALALHCSIPA